MLDDEQEELPLVSVGSGNYDLSNFSMPPADVLASQRAREQECEKELRLLRELHGPDDDKGPSEELQSTPSNSSELGELGSIGAEDVPATRVSVDVYDLVTQFLTQLPDSQFLKDYLEVLQHDSPSVIKFVNREMLCAIEMGLEGGSKWLQDEAVGCAAWLCALCLAANGLRARRTLHTLLQQVTPQQLSAVSAAVRGAVRAPRLLLQLSDVLRCPGPAARLADTLLHCALAECEEESVLGAGAGWWRSLTHVQVAGRSAAAGRPPPRLAAPHRALHGDALKIAVAACRLDHLCRNNNNENTNNADFKENPPL